ncbi:hypothetical protein BASA50_003440 [Batrachochytrium salamandrivorans]|uniref:Golgi SNAP receptor complex member 1 n=1 Tax=Batrachochytrium salamandrivorans TaxID=1357716 RepID=A0ABQ8FLK6_9FUNG|nr:hypothetical protein BASA60_007535 [Batrachochytrium salamandrivorans]KAH6598933.1 hypothetical protein BASA50_003440 [Batrachochytrium salamandrivorans]
MAGTSTINIPGINGHPQQGNNSGLATPEASWESLRKHARQLECEIDSRLVNFSKTASNQDASSSAAVMSTSDTIGGHSQARSDTLSTSQSIEQDLENLLGQLSRTIESMGLYLEGPGSTHPSRASMTHLLQRHKSNQFEYTKEFKKIKTNILSKREHAELLNSIRSDINSFRSGSGNSRDYFLTERERLENTNSMADEIFQNAMDSRDDLDRQRSSIFGSRGRLSGVLSRIPQLKGVLNRINSRKFRDTWVMGMVIGVGMCVLIWYALG